MLTAQQIVETLASQIAPLDANLLTQARAHLDNLTKPVGSLGRLEDIAAQLFAIREGDLSRPLSRSVYVFAADHGITAEGVSAYPAEVTRQMVLNFLSGGAAINVLARLNHAEINVVDIGVDADLSEHAGLLQHKVRRGTRNMLREPAMSYEEITAALSAGIELAEIALAKGNNLIAIGEMGIGNTTAASTITAALTGKPAALVTGKGTGLDEAAHAHKCRVVEAVVELHRRENSSGNALEILRRVGGLEIAAMAGMILGAAQHKIAVIADGFISTAAAAIACTLVPNARAYLFAGHQSEEPGHRILLKHLGIQPVLSLNMRLGEGTGAVLAMPVIEAAINLYREMATFASAGISGATE
jgi:nicotinate-nucleotide--dimethylbenzimidazole phosphoribosyltransferase